MIGNKKIIALIPARGGSKGLPRKNIALLSGKPLIVWTIEEAKKSKYIDKLYVSTDDKEIAGIVQSFGAEIPFIRPRSLSGDEVRCIDVVLHCIDFMENRNESYDILVLLQPTSPLRITKDIDDAILFLVEKKAGAIISVSECEHPPQKANVLPADGSMENFIKETNLNKNRQELDTYYRENGSVYVANLDYIKKQKSFYGKKSFAFITLVEHSVDVDSKLDLGFCEYLLRKRDE